MGFFSFFSCVLKRWYSYYFTSTRDWCTRLGKFVAVSFVFLLVSLKHLFAVLSSHVHCDVYRGISRSQTYLSLQRRRQKEWRAETNNTDIRLWILTVLQSWIKTNETTPPPQKKKKINVEEHQVFIFNTDLREKREQVLNQFCLNIYIHGCGFALFTYFY